MKKTYRVLICACACAAAAFLPMVGLELLLPPAIALAGFMAAEWGYAYLMPVALCGSVGFCVLQPWFASGNYYVSTPSEYCEVAAFILITVAAGFFMRRRLPNRYALLTYVIIACAGIYLSMTADSMFAGKPPYAGVVEYFKGFDAEMGTVLGDSYTSDMRASVAAVTEAIPDILMMLSLFLAELFGMFVFMMGRFFYRKFKAEPTRMAHYTLWRLPSSILWGFVLTAASCAAAFLLKLSIAPALAWTMGFAYVSMFAVQGFCFLSFLFERAKSPNGMRIFTVIFIALFMPYTAIFLACVGIYEQIGKKRLLIAAYERQLRLERSFKEKRIDYEKYGYTIDDIKNAGKTSGDKEPAEEDDKGSGDTPDDEGENNTDNYQ